MSKHKSAYQRRIAQAAQHLQEYGMSNKVAATTHGTRPTMARGSLEPKPQVWKGGTPRVRALLAYMDCLAPDGGPPSVHQRVDTAIDVFLEAMAENGYVLTKVKGRKNADS